VKEATPAWADHDPVKTKNPSRNNCLWFALHRFFTKGGYLLVRKSRHGWWPHFLWSSNLDHFEEWQPEKSSNDLAFPPFWFKGVVVQHDIHTVKDPNAFD